VTIFRLLEQATGVSWVIFSALFAALLIFSAGMLVRGRIAAAGSSVLPDSGFTLRNIAELIVEFLSNLAEQNMGPEWRRWFPVVGTIFVFILVSNLLGLVPGVGGATSDINATAAWALIAFGVSEWVGIRKHGWSYVNQFLGPSLFDLHVGGRKIHVRALAPIFLPLEIVAHLARVLSLSIRLLANMFADHTVVGVWLLLLPPVVPAIFMGLGVLVAFLQAYVFALLTMIYIGLALEEAH
jgi:F-type H+-transporting ATPase subunit a